MLTSLTLFIHGFRETHYNEHFIHGFKFKFNVCVVLRIIIPIDTSSGFQKDSKRLIM